MPTKISRTVNVCAHAVRAADRDRRERGVACVGRAPGTPSGSDMRRLLDTVAIVATILAIWFGLYAYAGDVAITSPWRTFAFAAELFSRASFWNHVGATMVAFAMALAISAVAGVALGLVLGMRRFAGEVAEPMLSSFYTIPKVT